MHLRLTASYCKLHIGNFQLDFVNLCLRFSDHWRGGEGRGGDRPLPQALWLYVVVRFHGFLIVSFLVVLFQHMSGVNEQFSVKIDPLITTAKERLLQVASEILSLADQST